MFFQKNMYFLYILIKFWLILYKYKSFLINSMANVIFLLNYHLNNQINQKVFDYYVIFFKITSDIMKIYIKKLKNLNKLI